MTPSAVFQDVKDGGFLDRGDLNRPDGFSEQFSCHADIFLNEVQVMHDNVYFRSLSRCRNLKNNVIDKPTATQPKPPNHQDRNTMLENLA